MALFNYRYSNEAIAKYLLVKPSSVAGRVEVLKVGDSAVLATGVALSRATQAGVRIKVQELESVEVPLLSDGTTTIEPQDFIEPSEILDGYVRKGNLAIIGVAVSGASASVGEQVAVLVHRNSGQASPDSGGGGGGGGPFNVTYDLGATHAAQTATLLAAKGGGLFLKNGADSGTAIATSLFSIVNYDETIAHFDVKAAGSEFKSTAADGASALALKVDTSTAWSNATARLFQLLSNGVEKFSFFASGNINDATKALFYDAANIRLNLGVLIGGQTATGRLHLTGNNGSASQLRIDNSSSNVFTMMGSSDTGAVGGFIGTLSNHPFYLRQQNNPIIAMTATDLSPYNHDAVDLGLTGTRYKNLYLSGNIAVAGVTSLGTESGTGGEAIAANLLVKLNSDGKFYIWQYTDDPYLVYGVAATACAGNGSSFIVAYGSVRLPIKSDGTTVIAIGDRVEPSPTVNGRVRKGETNPIGIATSSAVAVLDTLCTVRL